MAPTLSKELTIKLSDVRNCLGCPAFDILAAETRLELGKANETVLARMDDSIATIFHSVPNAMLEVVGKDGEWKPVEGRKELWLCDTYRLHRDVTVVDDTAEDGEYEFVPLHSQDWQWGFFRGIVWYALTRALAFSGYICTEVEDGSGDQSRPGKRAFVASFQSPYQHPWGSESIADLITPPHSIGVSLVLPLTPKRVVFRRKGD